MQCTDRRTVGGNLLDIIASHDDSSFFAGACRSADLVQAAGGRNALRKRDTADASGGICMLSVSNNIL